MTEKAKQFWKKVWEWVKWPILFIGGIIATIFIGKKIIAVIGNINPEERTHWDKIDDTTISVYSKKDNSYKRVELPVDRRTGKKIQADNIKAVGLSDKKVVVNVKSTHAHSTDVFLGND